MNLEADSYSADAVSEVKQHVQRFLGIQSSVDGTSEQAIKDWDETLKKIIRIFNNSPLAHRTGHMLRLVDIFVKLLGMHTDHCAKEKKDYKLLKKKKEAAVHQVLGEKEILEKSNDELVPSFLEANKQMIEDAGGQAKWDALPEKERTELLAGMMEKLVVKLGADAYEQMPEEEKRMLSLFIWAGCGCHKDLNTVKGGYAAIVAWWKRNPSITGPIKLPNRDNAAVLENAPGPTQPDAKTKDQQDAFDKTESGGIKATQLAGALFNHKDDKKGHHDEFRAWWQSHVGTPFTFPDTSNTRFQSHCEAAAMLLLHLDYFIEFLEYVRDKKDTRKFNNMEKNLYKALHCNATKTELAVLALYGQAVSHPYMKEIRGDPTLNMLNLGPLHKKIHSFMKRISEDPSFLIGPNVTHETGTFNGEAWHNEEVIETIQRLAPSLPYLKELVAIFFEGAGETWKRFTSEFSPGGLIDEATTHERALAWMPPTNDVNEGALGSFRVLMRKQPLLTLLQYNAQAMFAQNNTRAFMKKKLGPDDLKYIYKMARETAGEEKKRHEEIIKHTEENIKKKEASRSKRAKKAAEKTERIAAVQLIFDKERIKDLKGMALYDHLDAFKAAGAPLEGINRKTKVQNIRLALQEAIDKREVGEWVPNIPESGHEDSDSGEEFQDVVDLESSGEDESGWEDDDEMDDDD